MNLIKVRITEFQSIQDSNEFEIGDVTCLVGKNEAGKTSILKAVNRLNPINDSDRRFNVTLDYPRKSMRRYKRDIEEGKREHSPVVNATYQLESYEIDEISAALGPDCLSDPQPTLSLVKGYDNKRNLVDFQTNELAAAKHIIRSSQLPKNTEHDLLNKHDIVEIITALESYDKSGDVPNALSSLQTIANKGLSLYIFEAFLTANLPKFLYFDEYYQMKGQENLEQLRDRRDNEQLEPADHPLLGLIDLAGLDLDQLIDPELTTEDILAEFEGAGNELTQAMLPYWSQNKHLRMQFDVRPGQANDPEDMRNGTNMLARIVDTRHNVTTSLGTRSRGFIWFFSFLAWYQKISQEHDNIILLLDEPGLSLHAKAQGDLLRYFDDELKLNHQLIYTTHSPFMIEPTLFNRVRIVQDLSVESDSLQLPENQQGTKVITEVLEASEDSLFPLQGALGYEIHQTLFIGPNSLVVEGVSDLLYLQTMSAVLQGKGEDGLNSDWTITPVGGSGNVPTFVALIGAQNSMNIAVLVDADKSQEQRIDNIYREKLLAKKQVLTYGLFNQKSEADIEDMFEVDFYLNLINGEFGSNISRCDLTSVHPRLLKRIDDYLVIHLLPNNARFNHYRPARYFAGNIDTLEAQLSQTALKRFQDIFDNLNALLR